MSHSRLGLIGSAALAAMLVSANAHAATYLGRACVINDECGTTGLTCITPSSGLFGGEGPAKGYCSIDCSADASICAAHDPAAVCLEFAAGQSYCVEGCTFGPPQLNQFDPTKCHGRQEVACSPFFDGSGMFVASACSPQCNSDTDCGTGLYCSPKTGTCSSSSVSGKAIGEVCSQNPSGPDECRGSCTGLVADGQTTPSAYACTERCTLGSLPNCGWEGPVSGTPAPATCLFVSTAVLQHGGSGTGDLGSCGKLCNTTADCGHVAFACELFTDPQVQTFFQKQGYCALAPAAADGGAGSGGSAGSAGAATGGTGFGGNAGSTAGSGGTGAAFGGSAGAPTDGGIAAGGSSSGGGCGCRVGDKPESGGAAALLALAMALFTRRRAHRASATG